MEELVCFHSDIQIIYHCMDKLVDFAKRLADDSVYRTKVGNSLQKSIMQKEDFNKLFLSLLKGCSYYDFQKRELDYPYLAKKYMEIKKSHTVDIFSQILAFYKLKTFFIFGRYSNIFIKSAFCYLKRKLYQKSTITKING